MRKLHCPLTNKAFWWSASIGKRLLSKQMIGMKPPFVLKEPAIDKLYSTTDVLHFRGHRFSCYYDKQKNEFLVYIEKAGIM